MKPALLVDNLWKKKMFWILGCSKHFSLFSPFAKLLLTLAQKSNGLDFANRHTCLNVKMRNRSALAVSLRNDDIMLYRPNSSLATAQTWPCADLPKHPGCFSFRQLEATQSAQAHTGTRCKRSVRKNAMQLSCGRCGGDCGRAAASNAPGTHVLISRADGGGLVRPPLSALQPCRDAMTWQTWQRVSLVANRPSVFTTQEKILFESNMPPRFVFSIVNLQIIFGRSDVTILHLRRTGHGQNGQKSKAAVIHSDSHCENI